MEIFEISAIGLKFSHVGRLVPHCSHCQNNIVIYKLPNILLAFAPFGLLQLLMAKFNNVSCLTFYCRATLLYINVFD